MSKILLAVSLASAASVSVLTAIAYFAVTDGRIAPELALSGLALAVPGAVGLFYAFLVESSAERKWRQQQEEGRRSAEMSDRAYRARDKSSDQHHLDVLDQALAA
jgi:hypothetical protein|nr:hypothetical protein [Neorhizobium tomejilense]